MNKTGNSHRNAGGEEVCWMMRKAHSLKNYKPGFPGGAVVKNPPANAEYVGSSPGPGRPHMPRSN